MEEVQIPRQALSCSYSSCTIVRHKKEIDCFYKDICHALLQASARCINKIDQVVLSIIFLVGMVAVRIFAGKLTKSMYCGVALVSLDKGTYVIL